MAFILSISVIKKTFIGIYCVFVANNNVYTFGIKHVKLDRTVCGCIQMTRFGVNVATILSCVTQNAPYQFAVCVVFDFKKLHV